MAGVPLPKPVLRSIVVRSGMIMIALGAVMLPLACLDVDPVVDDMRGADPNGGRTGGITKSPNTQSPKDDKPKTSAPLLDCPQSFSAAVLHEGAPRAEMCSSAEIQALATACPLNTGMDTADCVAARASYSTCASCIFGTDSADGDKPIMLTPGVNPGFQFNQHTCFDYATGISGCGAQFINQTSCLDVFCDEKRRECWGDRKASREECAKSLGSGRCRGADEACVTAATAQLSQCAPTGNTLADYTAFFIRFTQLACGKSIADAGAD